MVTVPNNTVTKGREARAARTHYHLEGDWQHCTHCQEADISAGGQFTVSLLFSPGP